MLKQLALVAIMVVLVGSALSQTATIQGTVTDPLGTVICRAYVLFRTDALDREHRTPYKIELRTDKEGRFTASLPAGFYDLFIGAEGFSPYSKKVRTLTEHSQDINIVMKVDELMVEEYGDRFDDVPPVETQPASLPNVIKDQPH
jgi:carboxypeptidase family protein